jgi:D-glycerate 3-kinase
VSLRATLAALITRAADDAREAHGADHVPLIGLAGAQGSGKSFQARVFAAEHAKVASFSLDDVYHTRDARAELALTKSPLFLTRGPPGTHDLALAERTIAALRDGRDYTMLPRFDKVADERAPEADWAFFSGRPDLILLEGWCLGALPLARDDGAPLNALEREDSDGRWRAAIAAALAGPYAAFFDVFDAFLYLQAPSFEIVRDWRGEQERDLIGRRLTSTEDAALDRFVQHYERVTRAMLTGRHRARWVLHLDEARHLAQVEERVG